jgi:hypothetical protein
MSYVRTLALVSLAALGAASLAACKQPAANTAENTAATENAMPASNEAMNAMAPSNEASNSAMSSNAATNSP